MKRGLILLLLTVVAVLLIMPSTTYAYGNDTLVVAALPPGNLNAVMNADTNAAGVQLHHVYILQQTGAIDTTYFLTAPIRKAQIILIGVTNPKTKFPPVIAPFINADNSSPGDFFEPTGISRFVLKNLYLVGTRTDGSTVTGTAINIVGDSVALTLDHCVFENFGASGTPNLFGVQNRNRIKLYITNCMFRNLQCDVPQNPAFGWGSGGVWDCVDTLSITNCTIFIQGGTTIGGGGYTPKAIFNHNTVFNMTKAGIFTKRQLMNLECRNNVFFNVYAMGLDSSQAYTLSRRNSNFFSEPGVITLDTLSSMLITPYFFTEQMRDIKVDHNAYFWPKATFDNIHNINDTAHNRIVYPKFVAATSRPDMLTDRITWPGIIIANNDSIDPGFNATLVTTATNNMIQYGNLIWHNNTAGAYRPFVNLSDPTAMFTGVPATWATTQGYPVLENLRYSNTTLQHKGTDGKAYGDLNWFPEQLTGVSEESNSVPCKFSLNQNYPNPFNPSTQISYTLAIKGMTRLSVYDVLGREVAVLVNEVQNSGQHEVTFIANNLSSGVYFCKLVSSGTSSVMKMIMMK